MSVTWKFVDESFRIFLERTQLNFLLVSSRLFWPVHILTVFIFPQQTDLFQYDAVVFMEKIEHFEMQWAVIRD